MFSYADSEFRRRAAIIKKSRRAMGPFAKASRHRGGSRFVVTPSHRRAIMIFARHPQFPRRRVAKPEGECIEFHENRVHRSAKASGRTYEKNFDHDPSPFLATLIAVSHRSAELTAAAHGQTTEAGCARVPSTYPKPRPSARSRRFEDSSGSSSPSGIDASTTRSFRSVK